MNTAALTTATRAPQLCRNHPATSPVQPTSLGGTFQCHGRRPRREPIWRGGPTVTVHHPCGKEARWHVKTSTNRNDGGRSTAGWCVVHAAELLRTLMRQSCPDRIPLVAEAATARAVLVETEPTGADPTQEARAWARLRAANTAVRRHDRTHDCPGPAGAA